jgi:hypothetical protein
MNSYRSRECSLEVSRLCIECNSDKRNHDNKDAVQTSASRAEFCGRQTPSIEVALRWHKYTTTALIQNFV